MQVIAWIQKKTQEKKDSWKFQQSFNPLTILYITITLQEIHHQN